MLLSGNQGQTGKQTGQGLAASFGEYSEQLATELMPRYYQNTYRGQKYFVNLTAGAATAFTGGAGGTPLLSIYNPVGSGKNLVLVSVNIANRVAASAVGTVTFNIWGGPSAANTGTLVKPTNLLSLQTAGSVVAASSNAATTSTTAIPQILPVGTYYWATAAGAILAPISFDVAGMIIVAPGNLLALGATAALTSATFDATLVWDEVSV
jgi:hypothetical protein